MAEFILCSVWLILVVGALLIHTWPRITWHGDDWKHLRLPDDWDKDKSRGRIRNP